MGGNGETLFGSNQAPKARASSSASSASSARTVSVYSVSLPDRLGIGREDRTLSAHDQNSFWAWATRNLPLPTVVGIVPAPKAQCASFLFIQYHPITMVATCMTTSVARPSSRASGMRPAQRSTPLSAGMFRTVPFTASRASNTVVEVRIRAMDGAMGRN